MQTRKALASAKSSLDAAIAALREATGTRDDAGTAVEATRNRRRNAAQCLIEAGTALQSAAAAVDVAVRKDRQPQMTRSTDYVARTQLALLMAAKVREVAKAARDDARKARAIAGVLLARLQHARKARRPT